MEQVPSSPNVTAPALAPRPAPTATRRIAGGLVAAAVLAVLGLAAWLRPSPSGIGTHLQLGLMQCGWVSAFGKPCPTCGMTTSFAHAAHGHLERAVAAQPMGAALALASAAAFWIGLHVAVTGSDLGRVCGNLLRPRVLWLIAGAAGAAWAYKLLVWRQP